MMRPPKSVLAAVLGVVCLLAAAGVAQRVSKRLILKDGGYQQVTEWEAKGDRVRYYSAERYEWEEVPTHLVDWAATEKWNAERKEIAPETREISQEEEAERKEMEARTPEVAPGVRLPASGGVFLLDRFQGEAQAVELIQSGSEIEKNTGKNILRAAINPFAGAKQSIVLKGLRARIQAHGTFPLLYINIEPQDEAESQLADTQRFRIAKLQKKKDGRVVGNLKIGITGKVKQEQRLLPTVATPMGGGWLKVSPAEELQPGEYALVEMLNEKEMNLYVWDFGVDPSAPANPTAWKPAPPPQIKTGTDESPVLINR